MTGARGFVQWQHRNGLTLCAVYWGAADWYTVTASRDDVAGPPAVRTLREITSALEPDAATVAALVALREESA